MFHSLPDGYYGSEHWRHKRREALRFYNYTCQACGKRGGRLDVHHLPEAYQRLWAEPVQMLRPLCHDKCHPKGRYSVYRIRLDRSAVPWRNAIEFVGLLPVKLLMLLVRWMIRGLQRRATRRARRQGTESESSPAGASLRRRSGGGHSHVR